jgi:cysteine synthase
MIRGPKPNWLYGIGHTPLIKLPHLSKHWGAEIFAKCEYQNPTGWVHDRVVKHLVDMAEAQGRLKPGFKIVDMVDPVLGLSISRLCAQKKYGAILYLPENMAKTCSAQLEFFGAQVKPFSEDLSLGDAVKKAKAFCGTRGDAFYLNTLTSTALGEAHWKGTSKEIFEEMGAQINHVVVGVRSGHLISGLSRAFREHLPGIKLWAVRMEKTSTFYDQLFAANFSVGHAPPWDQSFSVTPGQAKARLQELAKEEGLGGPLLNGAVLHVIRELSPKYPGQRFLILLDGPMGDTNS